MIASSQFIVLAKRPYRESALLLDGASPDYGRLSLVLHGGQKSSGGAFPAADLYRELEVEFREDEKSTLHTAGSVELLTSFDAVAEDTRAYLMAGRIASFLLKNLPQGIPQPSGQDGEGEWSLEQCAVVLKTAYLYENGLLPEGSGEQQRNFLENLVAAGIDNSELPSCDPGYWRRLNLWLNALLDYHQLSRG